MNLARDHKLFTSLVYSLLQIDILGDDQHVTYHPSERHQPGVWPPFPVKQLHVLDLEVKGLRSVLCCSITLTLDFTCCWISLQAYIHSTCQCLAQIHAFCLSCKNKTNFDTPFSSVFFFCFFERLQNVTKLFTNNNQQPVPEWRNYPTAVTQQPPDQSSNRRRYLE